MQYFVVIGGGIEQIPMYKALKNKGIKSIAIDINSKCPAKKYCDLFIKASTRNPSEILKKLKLLKKKLIGVSTLGTDTPQTVSKVAKFFKLKAISVNSAINVSHKDRMKKNFIKNKINTPKYFICSSFKKLLKNIKKLKYPIILKPIDGRGSEGVLYIENDQNLKDKYFEVKNKTNLKNIIAEQYLNGEQYSAEGFFENGKFYLSGVALRYYDNLKYTKPYIIEAGGFMPANLTEKNMKTIELLMQKAGNSLGINKGPLKSDLVLHKKNFSIIEVAGRLSGNYLASHYIKWIYGINLIDLTINFALGLKNKEINLLRKNMKKFLSIRYFFPKEGYLKSVQFPKNLKKFKTFYDKKILFKGKKKINRNITHRDRVGLIRCVGNNKVKVKNESLKIIKNINYIYA
jgi:carbamoylphosphate synthase large subunit